METQKKKPFLPFVTAEQVIAYRPEDPTTSTGEPFIDAVVEAMCAVGAGSSRRVAQYMQLDLHQLSHTVKTITGLNLSQLRDVWAVSEAQRLAALHPDWDSRKLARHLGFAGRSSLWYAAHPDAKQALAERKVRDMTMLRRIREEIQADTEKLRHRT